MKCIRCDSPAEVVIETKFGTQPSPLCEECADKFLHRRLTIWRVKERLDPPKYPPSFALAN